MVGVASPRHTGGPGRAQHLAGTQAPLGVTCTNSTEDSVQNGLASPKETVSLGKTHASHPGWKEGGTQSEEQSVGWGGGGGITASFSLLHLLLLLSVRKLQLRDRSHSQMTHAVTLLSALWPTVLTLCLTEATSAITVHRLDMHKGYTYTTHCGLYPFPAAPCVTLPPYRTFPAC